MKAGSLLRHFDLRYLLLTLRVGFARGLLLTAVVFGAAFIFTLPPGYGPDEEAHFFTEFVRLQELFTGKKTICAPYLIDDIFRMGDLVGRPKVRLPPRTFADAQESSGSERCVTADFSKSLYGHILTYPGEFLARFVVLNPQENNRYLQFLYISRLFQFLCMMLVCWRLTSFIARYPDEGLGAGFLMAVVVTPLFIQQSAAVTSDTIINLFCLSCATCLLFLRRISGVDVWVYILSGCAAVTTKPVLLPLVGGIAVLLTLTHRRLLRDGLRSRKFATDYERRIAILVAASLAFCAIGGLTYLKVSSGNTLRPLPPADPVRQMEFLKGNPLEVFSLFFRTVLDFTSIESYFSSLGWSEWTVLTTVKNRWWEFFYALVAVEIGTAFLGARLWSRKKSFRIFHRIKRFAFASALLAISFASLLAYGVAVTLAMYLYWNKVGEANLVEGLQARYFTPIVLLLVPLASFSMTSLRGFENSNPPAIATTTGTRRPHCMARVIVISAAIWSVGCWARIVGGSILSVLVRHY